MGVAAGGCGHGRPSRSETRATRGRRGAAGWRSPSPARSSLILLRPEGGVGEGGGGVPSPAPRRVCARRGLAVPRKGLCMPSAHSPPRTLHGPLSSPLVPSAAPPPSAADPLPNKAARAGQEKCAEQPSPPSSLQSSCCSRPGSPTSHCARLPHRQRHPPLEASHPDQPRQLALLSIPVKVIDLAFGRCQNIPRPLAILALHSTHRRAPPRAALPPFPPRFRALPSVSP